MRTPRLFLLQTRGPSYTISDIKVPIFTSVSIRKIIERNTRGDTASAYEAG